MRSFVKESFSFDLEAWLSFWYRFHFNSMQLLLLSWNATVWAMCALGLTVILSLVWQFLSYYAFIRETPQAVHAESQASRDKHPIDVTSSCSRWWLGKDVDSKYHWLQMPWCLIITLQQTSVLMFMPTVHSEQINCWLYFPLQLKSVATQSQHLSEDSSQQSMGPASLWGIEQWAQDFD